jgi:hypothetical protein
VFPECCENYVTDPCESRWIVLPISSDVDGLAPESLKQGVLHTRPVTADDAVDVDWLEVVQGGSAAAGNVELAEELHDLWKKSSEFILLDQ